MKAIVSTFLFFLLLSSLQRCTTSQTVYTVTPDGDSNTTCHHCHNLQHYLLDTTKYFTSNTQLLFLPGLYHLHTDLIIQNVHNISLIGNSETTIPNVTIHCSQYVGIAFINITNLVISNMVIQQCLSQHFSDMFYNHINYYTVLFIAKCSVTLFHLHIHKGNYFIDSLYYAVMAVNIMGQSHFTHITCYGIYLYYNETSEGINSSQSVLSIDNFQQYCKDYSGAGHLVDLHALEMSYKVKLKLSGITIKQGCSDSCISCGTNLQFIGTYAITIKVANCSFSNIFSGFFELFNFANIGNVQFINCHFSKNNMNDNSNNMNYNSLLILSNCLWVNFSKCTFHNNNGTIAKIKTNFLKIGEITLENVNFSCNHMLSRKDSTQNSLIKLANTKLNLVGNIAFHNNTNFDSIISLYSNSSPTFKGRVKFSNNVVNYIIEFIGTDEYLKVLGNTEISFFENSICATFKISIEPFPLCIFQYYSPHDNQDANYSITFYSNIYNDKQCYRNIPLTDCRWLSNSSFVNILPLDINKKFIQYTDSSGTYNMVPQSAEQRTLCVCKDGNHPDCSINELSSYPGQDLTIHLYHNVDNQEPILVSSVLDNNLTYIQQCTILPDNKRYFFVKQCGSINYALMFPTDSWCVIFLKVFTDEDNFQNIFYIRKLPCPPGFLETSEECVCHPKLIKFGVLSCNIHNQTILRPANSWISATSHNNSYIYYVSLNCPLHYCIFHSLHLNLSTPNSQCQFNRSGVLCGECLTSLSTTFASSQCKHCSNVYLLLILPISFAGIVLVLLLFLLNLTVTDGTINAFILYVNITGINASVLFQSFTPTYTLTSLANLDLGIQTCFYNGMDEYAKMWLQLAFPFYLIFIATSLIITSRYSTTVQRFTARRALPVLATLFLLSYTKILHTVSSVLFFYSTVIQLPSEKSKIVWSVDANVPLLSFKFIILFIVCLTIFLIQVPFSIVLILNRPLRRFRYINKFKPLLDTYQGPYKNEFHYWTDFHLIIRVVFLGISALNHNAKVLVGVISVSFVCTVTGIAHPFKHKFQNYHEILLFLNLQILYIFVLNDSSVTATNTVVTMAAVHFTLIVMYHIITYMCGGVIRNKIQQGVNTIGRWSTNRAKTGQRFELANVPEAFNYCEYREPLVAED